MRQISRLLTAFSLLGVGYFLGSSQVFTGNAVNAQGAAAETAVSQEETKAITDVVVAAQAAKAALSGAGHYNLATKSLNVSAILSGGVDAMADLEAGRGVDPETFAGLYANDATDEVAVEIAKDEQGRLTYKGKVIRMYSVSKLKQVYQERLRFSGEDTGKKK